MATLSSRRGGLGSTVYSRRAALGSLWIRILLFLALAGSPGWAALAGEADTAIPSSPSTGLTLPLSVLWIFSMGADPSSLLPPVVQGDLVLISHDGKLHCLELQTGAEKWKFEPDPDKQARVSTAPVLVGDRVVVGADNAELFALNLSDGKEVWKTKCIGAISPSPVVLGEVLVAAARDAVYGIDPASGTPRWMCSLASPASWGPIADGAGLYFLGQDGSVEAVDPERGRFRWRSETLHGPLAFPPTIAAGRVLVASGSLLKAVARTGVVSWRVELPSSIGAQPTVVGDSMYVPCVDGTVLVLSARSAWDQRRKPIKVGSAATSPPLVSGGLVFVGTSSALVYAVEADSGEVRWVYRCRAPEQLLDEAAEFGIYASLVQTDGALLCLTGAGDLYCFSSAATDPIPPRFSDLKPEPNSALPGKEAVNLSFAVVDDGSGVDARSVTLTVDGNPVRVVFDPADGMGEITFPAMADGSHVVKATAKDYRGNEGSVEWSFLTDESIAPEAPTQVPGATTTQPARRTTPLR